MTRYLSVFLQYIGDMTPSGRTVASGVVGVGVVVVVVVVGGGVCNHSQMTTILCREGWRRSSSKLFWDFLLLFRQSCAVS